MNIQKIKANIFKYSVWFIIAFLLILMLKQVGKKNNEMDDFNHNALNNGIATVKILSTERYYVNKIFNYFVHTDQGSMIIRLKDGGIFDGTNKRMMQNINNNFIGKECKIRVSKPLLWKSALRELISCK